MKRPGIAAKVGCNQLTGTMKRGRAELLDFAAEPHDDCSTRSPFAGLRRGPRRNDNCMLICRGRSFKTCRKFRMKSDPQDAIRKCAVVTGNSLLNAVAGSVY